jgi:bifunctional UDP-N-acetylglucosamine pyrophosphorylase/glucosamine-1-phosphate N-acetyltransferase
MAHPHVVILAAGKGTRMKSARPKVLHKVAGRQMIDRVLDVSAALNPQKTTVVLGHCAELLKSALDGREKVDFVVQSPQLGTGHALLVTEPSIGSARGDLILLSGDVPLLSAQTLTRLFDHHTRNGAAATVLTAIAPDPTGYGRIVRSGERIARIVEDRDATPEQRGISEINSGVYAFAIEGLFDALRDIATTNAQHEYYLPDLVEIFRSRGRIVETVTVDDFQEIRGVNSRQELAEVSRVVRDRKNAALMAAGVTLEDPATTYIDDSVEVGADTIIHPFVMLEGKTTIGEGCELHSGVRIVDSSIGNRVVVHNHCVIANSSVESNAEVGPFARLRPDVVVGERAKVGNFVEMKKTRLGPDSKAMHLSYLGDAVIGTKVNIGAGTITCNYDGTGKATTTIEDGAFVGSDSQFIAPVTVGKGAYVGTGTTVRENVPPGSLAVSAGKQRNIDGWVEKKKATRKADTKKD